MGVSDRPVFLFFQQNDEFYTLIGDGIKNLFYLQEILSFVEVKRCLKKLKEAS